MDDADEHKLPYMNKLLLQMYKLVFELKTVGLSLQKHKDAYCSHAESGFLLTDKDYADWPEFLIDMKSSWFDKDYPLAIHAGFDFYLRVIQDGYVGEIADWITIRIKYVNVKPICLASTREHVKVLQCFTSGGKLYFDDLPMEYATHVSCDRNPSLRTADFAKAVNDACSVMKKIIERKNFLVPVEAKK